MISADMDLSAINSRLDGLTEAAHRSTRKAAQAGAQVYYEEVRARAPVSAKAHSTKGKMQTYEPGNLRSAIYQAFADGESGVDRSTYRISWNKKEAFYGRFVEFGTSKRAARPFLRPAYEAAQQRAISAVQTVLAAQIKKATGS